MRFKRKPDTRYNGNWFAKFAWLPVESQVTGDILWLETVHCRWWSDPQANWVGDDSRWLYAEIENVIPND